MSGTTTDYADRADIRKGQRLYPRNSRNPRFLFWLLQSCDMDAAIVVRRGPALYEFKTAGKMPAPQTIGPLSGRSAVQSVLRVIIFRRRPLHPCALCGSNHRRGHPSYPRHSRNPRFIFWLLLCGDYPVAIFWFRLVRHRPIRVRPFWWRLFRPPSMHDQFSQLF